MRAFTRLMLAAAMFVTTAAVARATPITYVHTGSGSGTLDGASFGALAPVSFTILATGDTSNIQSCGGNCLFNDNLTASITIGALGTFDFLTSTRYFSNNDLNLVGFSRAGLGGADLFNGPAIIADWDMATSFGTIFGTGQLLQWSASAVNTTGGVLVFNDGVSDATFTARVGGSSVPEPATLMLFGVGALALGRLRRRTLRP